MKHWFSDMGYTFEIPLPPFRVVTKGFNSSFPRRRESSEQREYSDVWTPAFAGVTMLSTFATPFRGKGDFTHSPFPILLAAIIFSSSLFCLPAHAEETPSFDEIERHIDSCQVESAKQQLSQLTDESRNSAKGKYLRGKYLFYVGQYKKADGLLKQAIEAARTELDWKDLRDQVEISRRSTGRLRTVKPQKGFTFHYRNGLDSVLIPYALETLEAQRQQLKQTLGHAVGNVRVYILPSVEMLSELCGLSAEQIEATGTVAITKYNRIMILSPSLIVGGYPWQDTLAHELTHLAITRITANRAPIWLHEGVAKLLEGQWRGIDQTELTPVLAYLLDEASREKRLIPLRRFHPSVSYLPNQEDAALAYAQVLSFLRFVTKRFKDGNSLRSLLRISAEKSLEGAFVVTTSYGITKLFRWWQKYLEGTSKTPVTLVPLMQRRFKTMPGDDKSNIDPILDREVRRHIRVGDLLRIRGHIAAAQKEYEWALEKNEIFTPDIVDRLVSTLLAQNKSEDALKLLDAMMSLYPNHSTVFMQAGEAYTKLGRLEDAESALSTAIALNPFHGETHCMLSAIYKGSGNEKKATIENDACLKLSSAPR